MLEIQSQLIKSLSSSEVIIWATHNRKAHPTVNCISFSGVTTGTELAHVVR